MLVRNYPLFPLSKAEEEELSAVLRERRLSLDYRGLVSQLYEVSSIGKSGSTEAPLGATAMTPRALADSPRMLLRSSPLMDSSPSRRASPEADYVPPTPKMDPRFLGSLSHHFVDVDSCLLMEQAEITTRAQTRQQIVLLKVINY